MNHLVSIIIPCRNEEKFIGKCLDSMIGQDYPMDKLEILVVDGMSEDRTKEIIKQYLGRYSFISVFENHKKIVPTALNIGLSNAHGEIIFRIDAHSIYEKDYLSNCVRYLLIYNADNIGGICITLPGADSLIAKSIALALSHPFGVGNSYFRIGTKKPKYVDTVPFGCYRRDVFEKIGLFDEDLVRNQDDEFNLRLVKNGAKILLIPDIISYYYSRDSLAKLRKMCFQYGYYKPLVAIKVDAVLTYRQLIPPFFVSTMIVSALLSFFHTSFLWVLFPVIFFYLVINIIISFSIALKKGFKYLIVLPVVFSMIHLNYGWGFLKGVRDFLFLKKHKRKKIVDIPLTR